MEHHGAALHLLVKDESFVEQLKQDYKDANITEKEEAILDYAVKLTRKPNSVHDNDIQNLRDKGCTDQEILDVCQITSYFNFVNRMAEGLGVQLEK
ncbi:carboxymuconolactone decarboxylase family protein [Bacillus sp. Marseille-Q3570]|uniref:carboxymuconolactone decarboxylase family protein n=1 Tax=Bacillus sp. Marseille-Q3570 TaxID=2963522 RepID=UPI0021B7391E|nr:peroxidase-related enzyme [Bacillus sp. Marseille-Q3570]